MSFPTATDRNGGARRAKVLVAGALVAGGLALTPSQADAAYEPVLQDRTLLVTGDAASDKLALRVPVTRQPLLELDIGDDGSTDFRVGLDRLDSIRVLAGDGDDQVRIDNAGAHQLPATTVDGQGGADKILGGRDAETLTGGDGDDTVDGDRGDDAIDLGAGNDLALSATGEGSDRVEGGAGFDTLAFKGSGANEQFRLSPSGARARLTRDAGALTADTGAVERVDVEPLDGDDALTLDDLTGTTVQELRVDLEAVSGGGAPDTGSDRLILNGTGSDDHTSILQSSALFVLGLRTFVTIERADAAHDELTVNTLAGDDRVEAGSLPSDAIKLVADGGSGDDDLFGANAADVLLGGDGNDFVDGGRGNDVARLGSGDDTFIWEAGDGDDTVEGQAGTDIVRLNGSSAGEQHRASADGTRVRLTRTVGGVADGVDAGEVERLSLLSFGGADTMIVDDLAATGVTKVDLNLFDFAVPGGNADVVIVNATDGDDTITAAEAGGVVNVTGLPAAIAVTSAAMPGDRLEVNALAGDDRLDSTGLPPARIQFLANASAGNDRLVGGTGDDVLIGADGDDVIFAGSGDNVALGENGDDVLIGKEGDDVLDGGAGIDMLAGGAGDDVLLNGEHVSDE